ncbi:hypothetical protein KCP78_16225 [Salmonella enterica subsp. enterica]|nr:hypothetical protein KCP78_16225 [Salmonella enterica subsp. enterica]
MVSFLPFLAVPWLLFRKQTPTNAGNDSSPANNGAAALKGPVALYGWALVRIIMLMATRMVIDNVLRCWRTIFAMSELTLGSTVTAVGTSLPELRRRRLPACERRK